MYRARVEPRRLQRLAGALFLLLGTAHLVGTLLDLAGLTRFFRPVDPSVEEQMALVLPWISSVLLAKMTVLDLYFGCSASMSLGMMWLGLCAWLVAPERRATAALAGLALGWSLLGWARLFWIPATAFTMATALLAVAATLAPNRPWEGRATQWFWAASALFVLGGPGHFATSVMEMFTRSLYFPVELTLVEAMHSTGIAITGLGGVHPDVWHVYVGFNLGHGWGLVGFGVGLWVLGRASPFCFGRAWVRATVLAFALGWLGVASTLFFYVPVLLAASASIGHGFLLGRRAAT
jgi:hypothetical protein